MFRRGFYDILHSSPEKLPSALKHASIALNTHLANHAYGGTASVTTGSARITAAENRYMNVAALWSILKSKERPVLRDSPDPAHLQIITLPEGVSWPFGGIGRTLFVRLHTNTQRHIQDHVLSRYEKIRKSKPDLNHVAHGCIIKGTSGIGKSAFLNLLVYFAAEMDVDVILHHSKDFLFVLHRDGTVSSHEFSKIRSLPALDIHTNLYLFDSDERGVEALVCSAFTVIAANSNKEHYVEFPKYDTMDSFLWMYPWTLDELLAAHKTIEDFGPWSDEILRLVTRRFVHVGGSLRLSMASHREYAAMIGLMRDQFVGLNLEKLQRWKESISSQSVKPDHKAPHLFLHCFPPTGGRITFNFGFSSIRSEKMIDAALRSKSLEEREFLVSLSSGRYTYSEPNFHHAIRIANTLRPLEVFAHNGLFDSTLSVTPEYIVSENPHTDVADALATKKCAYIQPKDQKHALFDAYYVLNNVVYCLRLTINPARKFSPTKFDALQSDISFLSESTPIFKYCWVADWTAEDEDGQPRVEVGRCVRKGHYYIQYRDYFDYNENDI